MSLASKQIPRSKMLSVAPRFCVTRPHEFFESVALLEILRTNDKSPCVCEDTVRKGHAEFGEKKEEARRVNTNACYGNSSGFAYVSSRIISPSV